MRGTPYLQQGRIGTFQIMLPFLTATAKMLAYLPVSYGETYVYSKDSYGYAVLQEENMQKVAEAFLKIAENGFPQQWQREWERIDEELTSGAREVSGRDLSALTTAELRTLYDRGQDIDQQMWTISIFIDGFDAGYDQSVISKIAAKHDLNQDEVATLLLPERASYITEWEIALWGVHQGTAPREHLYQKFFWYRTDYALYGRLDDEYLNDAIARAEPARWESPRARKEEILKRHNLTSNPLEVFTVLAEWRDERKRLNFTGAHWLLGVLREACRRRDIDPDLATGLLPHQVPDFFDGKIERDELAHQFSGGVLAQMHEDGTDEYFFGAEADRLWSGVRARIDSARRGELTGMIASRGRARGRVVVIINPASKDAEHMRKGDILVAPMTRPDFVMLMKKAGAIVTDEGGISSHAAIVSRELGVPCIIGTKNATQVLKNGDEVEVDAKEGIVKILKRNATAA
jgi:phosphohistidine swiveling domain-containing protein